MLLEDFVVLVFIGAEIAAFGVHSAMALSSPRKEIAVQSRRRTRHGTTVAWL